MLAKNPGCRMQDSFGGRNCASIGMLYTSVIMIPGSGELTTSVALHGSVTAKVRTGLFNTLRELTPMSNARHPGGAPVGMVANSLAAFSIGPLWHSAHTPFLLGGF